MVGRVVGSGLNVSAIYLSHLLNLYGMKSC